MPAADSDSLPDSLIWLTWVGAATSRLRLGTGVLVLPQRNPVVLAKQLGTLDAFTAGRVTLGVGIGWMKEEMAALGVPFSERVARTEEAIEVLRALWQQSETSFDGRFTTLERANLYPKPVQPGGPPIVVGGASQAAARRAGRLADGFFPANGSATAIAGLVACARTAARNAGRDPANLEITAAGRPTLEGVQRLADTGVVDRFMFTAAGTTVQEQCTVLKSFAESVIAKA